MTSSFPPLRRRDSRSARPARLRSTVSRGARARSAPTAPANGLLALVAVLALAVVGAVPALAPQAAAEQTPVTVGRVNLFHLFGADAESGTIDMGMTVDGDLVDSEDTVVAVPGAAAPVTDPALVAAGATTGWAVAPGGPLTLGWDASAVAADPFLYDGSSVSLAWSGPEGARVFLAQSDPTGQSAGLVPLLGSGSLELAPGSDQGSDALMLGRHRDTGETEVAPLTGAATWVFTQPGTYTLTASALSSRSAGSVYSNRTEALTYTIQVGDPSASPQPDAPAAPADAEPPAEAPSEQADDGDADPAADAPSADATAADAPAPSADATAAPSAPAAPATDPAGATPSPSPTAPADGATGSTGTAGTPGGAGGVGSTTSCELVGSTDGFETVLDHGHVDMFDLTSDAAGNLSLKLKEDVTGHGVLREPGSVLLTVKERYTVPGRDGAPAREASTYTQLPQDLRSQITSLPEAGYVLDANGADQAHVLWPGWDTLAARQGGYDAATFEVSYAGPEGGTIHAFAGGTLLGLESVLSDGGYALAPAGSTITQPYAAHKHVTWVFSHAGRYVLTVKATATKADGTTAQTGEHTYTIDVGERSSCLTPSAPERPGSSASPEQPAGTSTSASTVNAPAPGLQSSTAPVVATSPSGPVRAGAAGSAGAGAAGGGSAASGQCVATTVTREATEEEAARLGGSAANGSSTPAGGAPAASGASGAAANSATTTLTFNVGPGASGNATEGHFDLGPAIEDGTLLARIKDDRNQPASWVAPESLTFALGDAAAVQAPAALSFVATEGQTVWMIPSTQIAGVPWLGMNSQREEVVNGTKGGVTFTLDAVNGPGKVAVFNAGALGGGVGTHVFDGAGSAYHLPANTHAHQNWVFTEPGTYTLTISMSVTPTGADLKGSNGASAGAGSTGSTGAVGTLTPTGEKGPNGRPMVSEVVGRTPDGKPCDPNLARTGADSGDSLVASAALVLAGLVLVARRRRAVSE